MIRIMRKRICCVCGLVLCMALGGCNDGKGNGSEWAAGAEMSGETTAGRAGEITIMETKDLFTDRDRRTEYDAEKCALITLNGSSVSSDAEGVSASDGVLTIADEGSYLIRGDWSGQIAVDAKGCKVQLILDGARISCESSAALYVKKADKVFVTTAAGSENVLETTGEYIAIDDKNIDGAIFARDDITLNGNGKLTVVSLFGNGIVGKDDVKLVSGNYVIRAKGHGVQGRDSIRVADACLTIEAGQDGLHSGNDEDDSVGDTYIAGGELTVTAGNNGIHSDTKLAIESGSIRITESYEGMEACEIEIAGGDISIKSNDDGLNAAGGNEKNRIILSGGRIWIDAQGDGIDSNGNLYVNGGEIVVDGPADDRNGALDFSGSGYIYGGRVIALGADGMAVNFSPQSGQCSMMVTSESVQPAGTKVLLRDSEGEILLEAVSQKSFNNVVLSCPEICVGETYCVVMGDETAAVEMTETIFGHSTAKTT